MHVRFGSCSWLANRQNQHACADWLVHVHAVYAKRKQNESFNRTTFVVSMKIKQSGTKNIIVYNALKQVYTSLFCAISAAALFNARAPISVRSWRDLLPRYRRGCNLEPGVCSFFSSKLLALESDKNRICKSAGHDEWRAVETERRLSKIRKFALQVSWSWIKNSGATKEIATKIVRAPMLR